MLSGRQYWSDFRDFFLNTLLSWIILLKFENQQICIWAIPWFPMYTSDSSVLYLVINLSIYIIVKVMFQYSLVLFTSSTIENLGIFCSLEEKLVKYVGFGRTQRMVILHALYIIKFLWCVVWNGNIFCIFLEKRRTCVKGPSRILIF